MNSDSGMTDVIIIGAGVAGVVAAETLAARGIRVLLLDTRDPMPHCFKAEKIEADQAVLLRKFGVMEALLPATGRIRTIVNAQRGRVLFSQPIEQYGILYHDMVNLLRRNLRPEVEFRLGRVESVETGPTRQRVRLQGGEERTCRLVLVASGTAAQLCEPLGLRRRMIREKHSLALGYDIVPVGRADFPFDSVTYYPLSTKERIAYLTVFRIHNAMRANLFLYRSNDDVWVRQFMKAPVDLLEQSLPGAGRLLGSYEVTSRVEVATVHLFKTETPMIPGLLLIGDACQSVCPSTGTGLTRVLTDVDTMLRYVPEWLASEGMEAEKLRRYYEDPVKVATDASSLNQADYVRDASLSISRRWLSHQSRLHLTAWKSKGQRPEALEQVMQ